MEMKPGPSFVVPVKEVLQVNKGIPNRKAPKEYGSPNGALKNLLLKLLVNLTTIFNAIFQLTCYHTRFETY